MLGIAALQGLPLHSAWGIAGITSHVIIWTNTIRTGMLTEGCKHRARHLHED